jgi:hypothetical protein
MRQIKGASDVPGFVAEENSGHTDKDGKRPMLKLKLELSIMIEEECNPSPKSERKKAQQASSSRRKRRGGVGTTEWRRAKRRSQAFGDKEDKEEAYQSVARPWW